MQHIVNIYTRCEFEFIGQWIVMQTGDVLLLEPRLDQPSSVIQQA